jgi:hypothetical protein
VTQQDQQVAAAAKVEDQTWLGKLHGEYHKRLRAALPLVRQVIRDLAADSVWFDNVGIADSTPVECGRAVKRSDLAGWANYGYCASHSRWFCGLRLYLICAPAGMPIL